MRYIKVYENYNIGKPNLGNYVICWKDDIELNEFLSKNIGRIVSIGRFSGCYYVHYISVPENLKHHFVYGTELICDIKEDFIFWARLEEDLEEILPTYKDSQIYKDYVLSRDIDKYNL